MSAARMSVASPLSNSTAVETAAVPRAGEAVELSGVRVDFGRTTAVHESSLTVEAGEFFSFLGPSGCGKTTLLRLISGFIEPSAGKVRIGGRNMAGIGPNKRPTTLIFQSLALFPFMSVAENIAFGLEVRGVPKSARRRRAEELLDLIALSDAADKKVSELSGGQRQRVAIARALAVEPKVMLLDEPLSALDLKLRQHMRMELRALQRRTGVTFIYITHDQGEALAMSDRVAVMSKGRIQQVGVPAELYDRPRTSFVASFVGENNVLPGRILAVEDGLALIETAIGRLRGRAGDGIAAGGEGLLFVRPERLRLATPGDGEALRINRLRSTVESSQFEGSFVQVTLAGTAERPLLLQLPNRGAGEVPASGGALDLGFAPEDAVVLPPGELAHDH